MKLTRTATILFKVIDEFAPLFDPENAYHRWLMHRARTCATTAQTDAFLIEMHQAGQFEERRWRKYQRHNKVWILRSFVVAALCHLTSSYYRRTLQENNEDLNSFRVLDRNTPSV